jgi:hypothetical protein
MRNNTDPTWGPSAERNFPLLECDDAYQNVEGRGLPLLGQLKHTFFLTNSV